MKIPSTNFISNTSGQRYIALVNKFSNCIAVPIHSMGKKYDYTNLLERFDGILLAGGKANISPHNYRALPFPPDEPIDPDHNGTVFQIKPAYIDLGTPLFVIFRGLQEINVAMGGSLHYYIN